MPRTLSEQEFNAIRDKVLSAAPDGLDETGFQRYIMPALDGAIAEAENMPEAVEGSAVGRFASNVGEMVNPVAIAKGLYGAVRHPVETVQNIGAASLDQGRQALTAASEGRYIPAMGHAAGMVPLVGPAAVAAGEQIAAGDVAGGIGKAAGLLIPAAIPAGIRTARAAVSKLPERLATKAEGAAASRIADVMAPKVGANKARFGNMAEDVAPAIAKDLAKEGAPWTREGLHARVGAKFVEAEEALDAVSDARLAARSFPTQPLIDALLEKRRALTAEAVDGSQFPRTPNTTPAPTRAQQVEGITGELAPGEIATTVPIGKDVVPGPNSARVSEIDRAIGEIKQLGRVTRYEPIRLIRQAYDGPAKAVYSQSMTADYMKAQGGKLGAADVTGALREALAKWDPETAKANAPYSLYRKANDVMEATAEVERTRPRVGRQIVARLTGASVGSQAAGLKGAAAGYVLGPIVDSAVSSGMTTQLKTAALMSKLAGAIRKGDVGHVTSLTVQLRRLGTTAAAIQGNATSPNESLTQTRAPGY